MSAALLCPIPVHIGDALLVKVWYAHESAPGVQYVAMAGPVTAWKTGLADVTAEGYPTGCRWWLNGRRVLFYDGFESGTIGGWQ